VDHARNSPNQRAETWDGQFFGGLPLMQNPKFDTVTYLAVKQVFQGFPGEEFDWYRVCSSYSVEYGYSMSHSVTILTIFSTVTRLGEWNVSGSSTLRNPRRPVQFCTLYVRSYCMKHNYFCSDHSFLEISFQGWLSCTYPKGSSRITVLESFSRCRRYEL